MSCAPASQAQERKFTGTHMVLIMVAFFGVIISVNVFMAIQASSTWTGLVVKNSYVASQKFNTELKAANAQRAAGYNSQVSYAGKVLQITMHGRTGQLLALSDAKVEIGRPAFEQADKTYQLAGSGQGAYMLDVELAPGVWAITVTGRVGQDDYRRDLRLLVGEDGRGKLQ